MWQLTEQKDWALLEREFGWVRDMNGVPQDPVHHAEGNVATHVQLVLTALEGMEAYRQLPLQEQHLLWAAALLHDVEKRSTTVLEADGSITSKGHAKKGAFTVRRILYEEIPTPFFIREAVCALVRFHGLPLWAFEKEDAAKAVIGASLQVDTKLLALLARADVAGRICKDQEELFYKIDLFQALCEENECWGKPRHFATHNARFQYFQKEEAYPDFIPFDQFGSQVVLLSGLPGAGKDTYVKTHYREWPAISLDAIRKEHKIAPTDKRENGRVIQLAKETARTYLRAKQRFVWNATNITRSKREQLIDLFSTYKAFVQIVYIEVPYQQLHAQNASREAVLPRMAVENLIAKLEVPVLSEAHEVVYHVSDV
jgi:predicted kinase